MNCPVCNKPMRCPSCAAAKAGRAGVGAVKARPPEQARASINARWVRYYTEHPEKVASAKHGQGKSVSMESQVQP